MQGQRASILRESAGKYYFKKRGFMFVCWGKLTSVSHRSRTNKLTKRLTNKSERQQVRKYIYKEFL
jgi:hypothetical protein